MYLFIVLSNILKNCKDLKKMDFRVSCVHANKTIIVFIFFK